MRTSSSKGFPVVQVTSWSYGTLAHCPVKLQAVPSTTTIVIPSIQSTTAPCPCRVCGCTSIRIASYSQWLMGLG